MLSIGVVAHQSRALQARNLASQIGADYVSTDDGSLGCDDNHDAVQSHLAALPTLWSVIVEDDAVPIPGFRDQLTQALTIAPAPIVSLYLGRLRPPWAQNQVQAATEAAGDADWILSTHLLHAVGYAIKTELIPSLLHYPTALPVDQHITRWAQAFGHTIAYTWPSLVDHRDDPTLFDHPDGQQRVSGRIAWKTGPHPTWSTRSVTLRIT